MGMEKATLTKHEISKGGVGMGNVLDTIKYAQSLIRDLDQIGVLGVHTYDVHLSNKLFMEHFGGREHSKRLLGDVNWPIQLSYTHDGVTYITLMKEEAKVNEQ